MPPSPSSYWALTRAPRYSLVFALPLLVAYELLAFLLSHDAINGVRNGADVVLKSVFIALGGRWGLVLFGVVVIGTGVGLVVQDLRRHRGGLRRAIFAGMLVESIVYALLLGSVVGTLTGLVLHRLAIVDGIAKLGLPTQLMVSLGAGLYEELLFRVILVGALAAIGRKGFGWPPWLAGTVAAVVGAVIFSAFHYVGPYGDTFTVGSFVFRAIAGLVFSGMYLTRGFGITAWSHALYDVGLSVIG